MTMRVLAGDEAEACPKFKNELLHLGQNGRFKVFFAVGIFQSEKIQEVGIAKHQVRGERVFLPRGSRVRA